jgi:hypothetical protein
MIRHERFTIGAPVSWGHDVAVRLGNRESTTPPSSRPLTQRSSPDDSFALKLPGPSPEAGVKNTLDSARSLVRPGAECDSQINSVNHKGL